MGKLIRLNRRKLIVAFVHAGLHVDAEAVDPSGWKAQAAAINKVALRIPHVGSIRVRVRNSRDPCAHKLSHQILMIQINKHRAAIKYWH